ncbi:dihydroorotate dehydrogenase (quinone) [Candidatus Ichthyocystis sparus]|uniref:dihydroorotate dehydrogenase (quinone) n=1 Tax=Candidatus Ichthyocystis sparus TaxID=1561004 RepID=UPI00159EBDF0|nr:dihydroorotate dehydrogenase (quinone) [Candidatus Ichthyocystis sparus]
MLSKPLIRIIDPELAHDLSLNILSKFSKPSPPPEQSPLSKNGVVFRNRIGLAAGFDKDGKYVDLLSSMGFGFIEIGTVTPKPQHGHSRPRLFRSFSEKAIVNRMGFNNHGIDSMVLNLKNCTTYRRMGGIIGVNVGKNAATPIGSSYSDYITCIDKIYALCDYITINISSPNTPLLRSMQEYEELGKLLPKIKLKQLEMKQKTKIHTPIFIKFSPDLSITGIEGICELLVKEEIEGIILTNTTVERNIRNKKLQEESGGLSGAPLKNKADKTLEEFNKYLNNKDMTIVGVGGICSSQDAQDKFNMGANLVQIYSGIIFEGPDLVRRCINSTTPLRG